MLWRFPTEISLLGGVNSAIFAYSLQGDSALFIDHIISLAQIGIGTGHFYDPKLLYDEHADRFILVFLRDNTPANSAIMVAFSSSNNPLDPWHVYELSGNPLQNNRWTDFPAISITEEELFITGNLIIPGVSWQVGFDGSVIWQIDKGKGYNNDSLDTRLYSQVEFKDQYTRNIHPVRGSESIVGEQYFLSNRNFDIQNDSIFIMKITGTLDDPNTELLVNVGQANTPYGVPPNGRQADTDLNDPTKGLQTNDARVLGAVYHENWIQFVGNTKNFKTGYSAIYHGTINNPLTDAQQITAKVIGDSTLDFGYPNLAFTGNENCDIEAIIGVNYSSPTDFPGVGAFYYGNDSAYSEFVRLKEGENFTNRHSDSYERWGDYFGIQRKFNDPGKVWTAGYWGLANNNNATWFNELATPDTNRLFVQTQQAGNPLFCSGTLELNVAGGVPPYSYTISGNHTSNTAFINNICDGDTLNYIVTDSRGCQQTGLIVTDQVNTGTANAIYPNPASTQMVSQFTLKSEQKVTAYVYDMSGRVVEQIIDSKAKQGLNELHFDISTLSAGTYVLRVFAGDENILSEKFVRGD
ncbi:MAG: T9SS type A sorting domain-containing protein [Owenweeksia sp.]|nr:T9SS type A sorting domain-containing protein [Owenweeksia sp.]